MIVDADAHVNEIEEIFSERYLDRPFQIRRPRIFRDERGRGYWMVEGSLIPKPTGRHCGVPEGFQGIGPKATAPILGFSNRLKDMDREGIEVQVVYPTLMLGAAQVEDKKLAAAMCRAYNRWLHDQCQVDPRRLRGVAVVPLQEPVAAVVELRYAIRELNMIAVTVPGHSLGKSLHDEEFHPFFAAVQELDVPVGVHAVTGAYPAAGTDRFTNHLMGHIVGQPFEQMVAVVSVVCGGLMELFPRLRWAFLEVGVGWVPYWVERMDEHYEKHELRHQLEEMAPYLKHRPSYYAKSGRCYWSPEVDEQELPHVIEVMGEDCLLFASDYPHGDSRWPDTVSTIMGRKDISESAKAKILGTNPQRFYGF
ncbi:MAG: amidohydrolase [Deltaproteobacteria bacterium]|nr:amidohydrolase [Deltaproteobacteria bacterium]